MTDKTLLFNNIIVVNRMHVKIKIIIEKIFINSYCSGVLLKKKCSL